MRARYGYRVVAAALLSLVTTPGPVDVEVVNAVAEVRAGEAVDYRIAVDNTTGAPMEVAVRALLPTGLRQVEAGVDGTVTTGQVVWWLTLPPGAARELRIVGEYGFPGRDAPPSELIACVYTDLARPPVACGSHVEAVGSLRLITAFAWIGLGAGLVAFSFGYLLLRRLRRSRLS